MSENQVKYEDVLEYYNWNKFGKSFLFSQEIVSKRNSLVRLNTNTFKSCMEQLKSKH
jgi:hypothetical protein